MGEKHAGEPASQPDRQPSTGQRCGRSKCGRSKGHVFDIKCMSCTKLCITCAEHGVLYYHICCAHIYSAGITVEAKPGRQPAAYPTGFVPQSVSCHRCFQECSDFLPARLRGRWRSSLMRRRVLLRTICRKTDSIHHHHPEGLCREAPCLNSSAVAVSEVASRRWWCIESLFPKCFTRTRTHMRTHAHLWRPGGAIRRPGRGRARPSTRPY